MKQIERLWESGVALSEAWEYFGEPASKEELNIPSGIGAINHTWDGRRPTSFTEIMSGFHNGISSYQQKHKVICQMRECLLDKIFEGELAAIGKLSVPTFNHRPVRIAGDIFDDPVINWEASEIVSFGKQYRQVRVIDPIKLASLQQRGPAGSKAQIKTAILELALENPEFYKLPKKLAAQLIRNQLNKSENDRGFSTKNLEKLIVANSKLKPN